MADVLVVDDDPAIREVISAALSMDAIPHRTADNGAAALTLVAEQLPALVLLDINMPVLDGVRFCRVLEEQGARRGMAVVVMTAAGDAARYEGECGADGRLAKPFDLTDLYAVVDRYLPASH